MTPHYADDQVTLYHGDCRDVLSHLSDIDAVVTDPPYELGFMGRSWDSSGVAFQPGTWRAVYDAMKPGAHLLAFGGTRTYHRIAVAIEDAGFQVRDTIAWMYGSGFPKSLDVSKAIDKAAGAEREVVGEYVMPADSTAPGRRPSQGLGYQGADVSVGRPVTAPSTHEAKAWEGWGTALKPAYEPIIVARKPLTGTVAANVLEHGTGALNIDGCRIPTTDDTASRCKPGVHIGPSGYTTVRTDETTTGGHEGGRWPANVVLDEEAGAMLDAQSGNRPSKNGGSGPSSGFWGGATAGAEGQRRDDDGGASRFFYCAKARSGERPTGDEAHPTVKPLDLMRWLVRLVTPPGGVVLDPFAGTGTTAEASIVEGFRAVLIEQHAPYLPLIEARLRKPIQPTLGGIA